MSFDPSQPYEVMDAPARGFDPAQPFEMVDASVPSAGFDPSRPFSYEPAPDAERTALRDPNAEASTVRSTVTGMTPPEAQARGEFGDAELKKATAQVAAPALRVGGPLAGVALAPFTGLASLPAGLALGTAGAALAEPIAQQLEIASGDREQTSFDEGVLNVAIGGPLAAVGIPFANRAGASVLSRVAQAGMRATEGGAINAGQGAVLRGARDEEQDLGTIGQDFAVGAVAGGLLGTAFDEIARSRNVDGAFSAARDAGFQGQNVDELRTWWESQRLARARNVTPGVDPAAGLEVTTVPREIDRLAGGVRAAELPAPPVRPALAGPSSSAPVDSAPAPAAALDSPPPGSTAPSGAAPSSSVPREAPAGALGIAAGAATFGRIQRLFDPQSVLPEEFRRAVRFGQQGEAAILSRAKLVQGDLSRALAKAAKTQPGAADATFAYLTGQQPITALPPELQFPAQQARSLVDSLSDRAIREGVVQGDLAQTFADNLGTYLRRSYRLFADPNWFPDQPTRDRAAAYIQANWNPKQTLSRREADTVIAQLLDRPAASQFIVGGKIAGRDVSSLVARQDLAPEIRALYGEITEPVEAFAQTVPRLARLIENHHAQQWIRLAGLRTGVFTPAPTPINPRPLVGEQSDSHEVWRGLYTTPEVAEAMTVEARNKPRAVNIAELVGSTVRTFTSIAKLGKTVLNPDSYAPNILGGLVSMAANGNFNVLPAGRGILLAAEELGALRAAGVAPQTRTALQQDIEKLTRLGLRGDGISAADLLQTWERSLLPALMGKTKRIVQPWLRGYGAIDDTTKYLAWKSELARLKGWNPGAPLDRLEREAAERVRATMPTYSQIPKWVRQASQLGIAPSFVSFTYEVFRNTANSARLGFGDLRQGIASGNAAQARDGARRIAALLAVLGVSSGGGLAALSRRENNVTDDQDEAVRFFGPQWNRNGMLMYNRPVSGGRAQYSNVSYLLPHALVFEALEAGSRGATGEEQAERFMGALTLQFLSADGGVFVGPAIEAYVGVDRETGRPIVNRESPTPTADAFRYVFDRSLTPLAVAKVDRMVKAARGEQGPFGRVYSLSEEAWRTAGVRAQSIDFGQAAQFKARELARRWGDATNLYRTMQGRNIPEADLNAAYERSEAARQRVQGELQTYLRLGQVAGVSEDDLIKNLRTAQGLGAEEILGLVDGRYVPGSRDKREGGAQWVERVQKLDTAAKQEALDALRNDPALQRAVNREVETLAKGITQKDRLVLALDTETRGRWVLDHLLSLPAEERAKTFMEFRRKGIITDAVKKELGF